MPEPCLSRLRRWGPCIAVFWSLQLLAGAFIVHTSAQTSETQQAIINERQTTLAARVAAIESLNLATRMQMVEAANIAAASATLENSRLLYGAISAIAVGLILQALQLREKRRGGEPERRRQPH